MGGGTTRHRHLVGDAGVCCGQLFDLSTVLAVGLRRVIVLPHIHGIDTVGRSGGNRSPGLHMSDIYGDFYREYDPKKYDKGGPMNPRYMEIGLILEQGIEEGFKARHVALEDDEEWVRPDECVTDEGIYFSPDGIVYNHTSGLVRLGELKCTWMSCKGCPVSPSQALATGLRSNWDGVSLATFPPKFDKYFCQMMAYTYHLGLQDGRLIVFFVNGENRAQPTILAWDLHWNDIELYENWSLLLNHALSKGMVHERNSACPAGYADVCAHGYHREGHG